MGPLDSCENGRVGCGKPETGKSTLAKMGNYGENGDDVVPTICNFFVTNPCLGPSAHTTQTYSDASTKNAILYLRRVHSHCPIGNLQPLGIRLQILREPFGNATRRVVTNPDVFKAILLRWMTICNIPFDAVENVSFRFLAGDLAARVRLCCTSPIRYEFLQMVQTASYAAKPLHLPFSVKTIRSWNLDTYQKPQMHVQPDRPHEETTHMY